MLPSTGYFKGLNCPFYDSGLCERPYCHFRHVKKESLGTVNDSIENGAILQKLVSKVVQKVLQQSETSDASNVASITDAPKEQLQNSNVSTITKATYNPTPIFKLNKINNSDTENDELSEQRRKHIPVPYTPRKPTCIPIKRPVDSDDYKPFIYNPPPVKYTPGVVESPKLDPYTPKGAVEFKEKYLPGTEVQIQEYAPKETQTASQRQYIPSDKSVCKKKLLEYKPANITQQNKQSVTYQPTPCSLVPCFSSDEEEPVRKKPRLSSDLNGLDELGPEFDILDQIFDEEKLEQEIVKRKFKTLSNDSNSKTSRSTKLSTEDKKKSSIDRDKSSNKQKSDSKVKSSEGKHDKSRSSHDKSEHKSLSKEKDNEKDKKREKEKSMKEKSRDKDRNKDKKQDNHKDQNKHKGKDKDKEKDKSSDKKQSSSKSSSHKSSTNDNSSKHSSHSEKSSKHKEKTDHKHKKTKDRERHSRKSKDKDSNGLSTSDQESDNVDQSDKNIELNDEDIYEISESDEESIALECKRIFEEYVPTEKPAATEVASKLEENNENEYLLGKKRVSRAFDKNIKTTPKLPVKPDYKVSAAQAMAERLAKVREFHASKKSIELKKSSELQKTEDVHIEPPKPSTTPIVPSKIRIAHVPYASTLMNAKRTISTTPRPASIKSDPGTSSTITQTVKKGEKRLAHVPNDKFIDRPGVLEPLASKIPANIRTTYLNMMIDECLKIYILVTDAYNRAQHEELNTSKKCSTVQIYKNSAVLTVSRLRKELQECKGVKKSAADCNMLQRIPQGVSGSSGNAGSWSIVAKNRKNYENIQEYRGSKLYNNIQKWVLTEEQLRENGFPRPHISGEKGRAMIENQRKQKPPVGNLRTCCRCRKEYTVNKKCFPTVKEECIYHPNNKYRVRGEAKYQCCSQDATSDGCCVAPTHVYEYVDYENLKGYVKTLPPERELADYGVYSLDCEMCYTTHGLDLTRITVINDECKVVYETLIKPLHPIIDYNTRYSGITEEHMADVKTTLLDVQATLLTMFNSKTILVGHSLESDFKALKLIHDTVIDTSVLFPHKMGPPYKRALRNLCSEHLKKIIQNSVDGHDSAEDATVCMELLHYKLKEYLKTR